MVPVSLLIPCYNASRYLPQLWESIRALEHPFAEIICYNDGSLDNTVEVAESLGARVIGSEENRGPGFARNRLAEAAANEWIHFHDADDLMRSDFLSKITAPVSDNVDVVLCDSDWIDETSGQTLIHWQYKNSEFEKDPLGYLLVNPSGVHNVLYRKSVFQSVGGFREDIRCWEDGDLGVRLAAAGSRFHAIEETLVTVVRHSRGASSNQILCSACRLKLLEEYSTSFDQVYHPLLGQEAEKVARNLLSLGDRERAKNALALCKKLRYAVPTSKHPLIRLARCFFSSLWLLERQEQVRRRSV